MTSAFTLVALLVLVSVASHTVPSEYRCQPLNSSTLSYECPNILGPPSCPVCYTNYMADYNSSSNDDITITSSMKSNIIREINKNIQFWLEIFPPTMADYGYAIVDGYAGISLMFLRLYKSGFDKYLSYSASYVDSGLSCLNISSLYIDSALTQLPKIETSLSYYTGNIGVWTVAANIEFEKNDQTKMSYYIGLIQNSFEQLNALIINNTNTKNTNSKSDSNSNKYKNFEEFVKNKKMKKQKKDEKNIPKTFEILAETGKSHSVNNNNNNDNDDDYIVSSEVLDDCTLFYGLAGALYNALELNYFFNKSIINDYIISNITYYILSQGISLGELRNHNYLEYSNSNGCLCIGQDNGSGGIVKILLMAAENNNYLKNILLLSATKNENDNKNINIFEKNFKNDFLTYITETLNYFMSRQLSDGNMPTSIGNDTSNNGFGDCLQYGDNINDSDSRVQWDHGGPGFISLFSYAANIYDKYNINTTEFNGNLLNAAMKAYNATWQRGLLVKGLMYCHGIGGNIYMLNEIYHNLQNYTNKNSIYYHDLHYLRKQSAWRTKQFINWTLDVYNKNFLRYPCDVPFSMYQGTYGVPVLYSRLLNENWPDIESCHPGYMLCKDFV